jgi:hypothetical protein
MVKGGYVNQNRVSKGTPKGGEFAEDRKPDGADLVARCTGEFSDQHQYDDTGRCGWCGAFKPGVRKESWTDTKIAAAYEEVFKKSHKVNALKSSLYHVVPYEIRTHDSAYIRINGKYEVASTERIREMFDAGEFGQMTAYNHDHYVREFEKYDEAKEELDLAQLKFREENRQYEGWSRFFLVPGGHIHSSLDCSTCNKEGKQTRFGWLPDLSGLNEEDAVKEHGAVLCTVCYPSAPVEYTNKFDLDKEAKAEKRCPSSGRYVGGRTRGTRCTECNAWVSITSGGNLRAHDKAK